MLAAARLLWAPFLHRNAEPEGPKLHAGPGARIAEFGSPVTLENLCGAWPIGHTQERFVECVLVSCGRCNEAPPAGG